MTLRRAIVLAVLATVVVAGYWFGWFAFVAGHWLIILLSVYLLLGLATMLIGAFFLRQQLRQVVSYRGMLFSARARTAVRDANYYRTQISEWLMLPSAVAFWPVDAYLGIAMKRAQGAAPTSDGATNVVDLGVRTSLISRDAIFSVLAALSALLMLLVAGLTGRTDTGVVVAAAVILAMVFLRHVRHAVSVHRLPVVLRRIKAHPFVTYVLILAADGLSLVLCDRLLLNRATPFEALDVARITDSWRGLFDFTQLQTLVQHQDVGGLARLGVGGLFYFTLGKSLLNFKDFVKDDADRVWRASALLQLKRYADGLSEIRAVKVKSGESEMLSATIHLCLDRIDRAVEKIQSAIVLLDEKSTPDIVVQLLAQMASIHEVGDSIKHKVIDVGLDSHATDWALQAVIPMLYTAEAGGAAARRALLGRLGAGYPLSRARLLMLAKDHAAAVQVLEAAVPASTLEDAIRLLVLLQARILGPTTVEEDRATVDAWCATSLPIVVDLARQTHASSDLSLLHGQIAVAQLFIEAFVDVSIETLKSCAQEIEHRLADSQLFMNDIGLRKAMLERLRAQLRARSPLAA
jgi:hypothetical protein